MRHGVYFMYEFLTEHQNVCAGKRKKPGVFAIYTYGLTKTGTHHSIPSGLPHRRENAEPSWPVNVDAEAEA